MVSLTLGTRLKRLLALEVGMRSDQSPGPESQHYRGINAVTPIGRLDHNASKLFEEQLAGHVDNAITQGRHIVVDLTNVAFLSSIILKIIRTQKDVLAKHGLKLALCSATPVVTEILEIAKFHYVAELHRNLDDAALALNR